MLYRLVKVRFFNSRVPVAQLGCTVLEGEVGARGVCLGRRIVVNQAAQVDKVLTVAGAP